jgi:hypothetical protein
MTIGLLKEGVLNDDVIMYPEEGKVFKGNYIAIVERYEYANEWSDTKVVKRFRDENQLEKYLNKFYPNY